MFLANIPVGGGHHTIPSMRWWTDRDDDLKIGIKSAAILFGENDRLIIGILLGVVLLALMGAVGWLNGAGAGNITGRCFVAAGPV
ncbi:hypothetical protein MJK72_02240 [Klebsiella pneumoniae]|nr:hypothetical protein MJK72_02240 [Klebsiella pneumoniae]